MARPREASKGAGTLVLVNTTSFTSQSSININNCFSSSYENYKIMILATSSTTSQFTMRLRASGTDSSGSNYNLKGYYSGTGAGNIKQCIVTAGNNVFNTGIAETYDEFITRIAAKDVPSGTSYKIVPVDDIPTDRTFRNAWEYPVDQQQ